MQAPEVQRYVRVDHKHTVEHTTPFTVVYTLSFWAARRLDSVDARFGPYSKIARAVRESQGDIRAWIAPELWRQLAGGNRQQ